MRSILAYWDYYKEKFRELFYWKIWVPLRFGIQIVHDTKGMIVFSNRAIYLKFSYMTYCEENGLIWEDEIDRMHLELGLNDSK